MHEYEPTELWRKTLSSQAEAGRPDAEKRQIERLRNSYRTFRSNVALLAAEIGGDLRTMTVHDITHIDALWNVASQLTSNSINFTPLEGFILGSTFLIHDLGMAISAYAGGIEEIQSHATWKEHIARSLYRKFDRTPTQKELAAVTHDQKQEATEFVLRMLHAERANYLATMEFRHPRSPGSLHLLEDSRLRAEYGELIGEIAYSHWWDSDKLNQLPSQIGPMAGFPPDWTIDPLKIAVVLRVADVCHITAERAPALLRALRKPSGVADKHWQFQEYMADPVREGNLLRFTSARSFAKDRSDAWWLALEMARLADREIASANSLLRSRGIELAVCRVADVDRPELFAKSVRTIGWNPINTEIRVTHVADLVRRLGGSQLYGNDLTVPVRELIQNARDAVVARRLLDGRSGEWGEIIVRLGKDNGQESWLEVEDNGKGMSKELLTTTLLDFGASYWNSQLSANECPELFAKGFEPAGRFGIGFFSIFMLGNRVTVRTRTSNDGQQDTRVLEFAEGTNVPPILRTAEVHEQLLEAGTTVRVYLTYGQDHTDSFLCSLRGLEPKPLRRQVFHRRDSKWSLVELCQWLAPASDVNLNVIEKDEKVTAVRAHDWLTLDAKEFLKRLHVGFEENFARAFADQQFSAIADAMEIIRDEDGRPLGRAMYFGHWTDRNRFVGHREFITFRDFEQGDLLGVTTAGPFRADSSPDSPFVGLFIGQPESANRFNAVPVIRRGTKLGEWATRQARKVKRIRQLDLRMECDIAMNIQAMGGRPVGLAIARDVAGNFLVPEEIEKLGELFSEVELFEEMWHPVQGIQNGFRTDLTGHNQFGVGSMRMFNFLPFRKWQAEDLECQDPLWRRYRPSLLAANIEAWSRAWHCSIQDVISSSSLNPDGERDQPAILRRPKH